MSRRIIWTDQEDDILFKHYEHGYKEVQRHLQKIGSHRSKASIECRGSNKGISKEYHVWTEEQDYFLHNNRERGRAWLQSRMRQKYGVSLTLGNISQRLRRTNACD